MVGVAGRSKGCVTCRKKKKGTSEDFDPANSLLALLILTESDYRHPACSQCNERNIICGGYDLDRVFIYSKHEHAPPLVTVMTSPVIFRDLITLTAFTYRIITPSLARSAFTAEGLKTAFKIFPSHKHTGNTIQLTDKFSSILETLSVQKEALHQTILAKGLVTLGMGSNDQTLLRQGQTLYGKALQELLLALQDPARRNSEALIATTGLMGLYETLYPADEQSLTQVRIWMSHAQGELALIIR